MHISPDEGTVGLGSKSGVAFGGRYGIRISGPFTIAAEATYFPTEHAVLDTVVVDSAFRRIDTADHTLITGTAALRVNLTGPRTWHALQPFLELGAGVTVEADRDEDAVNQAPVEARYEFGTSFAGLLGGGIAWVPTQRLAIRVDGRNLLWKIKTPAALLRGNTGSVIPTDEWVRNLTLSAGLSILF
ncbi:MAG: hypothetical protein ACT4O1_08710 [Gemmatimonadota bacterium]